MDMLLISTKWNTVTIHYIHVLFYFLMHIHSLEWDEIQWRDIGDDGAIALTDPRVFNNFKILK